jgi:LacI family transcriptional regulator
MPPTIKDVAEHAEVSTATVSRVINNDKKITQKTRKRVLSSIRDLNYKVNKVAQSLKRNRTQTIGFITPEIANEFFMTIAGGAETVLKEIGYNMIICNSNEDPLEEKRRIELLLEQCVDGIIIVPASGEGKHFKFLADLNIPVVLADRLVKNFSTDSVLSDNFTGCYKAAEYLISRGCSRIGFISGNLDLSNALERFEGFKQALEDHNIVIDEEFLRFGDFHIESGYRLFKEITEHRVAPDAIFIANSFMQIGAAKYLYENNGKQPGNILIAGFDESILTSIAGFSVLCVEQPVQEIGIRAAQLMMKRINKVEIDFPVIERLPTKLVIHEGHKV